MRRLFAIALFAIVVFAIGCGDDPDELEIRIDTGVIHGKLDGDARAFLGVPYAAPPVGDLRFKPPQPPLPLAGVYDAIQTGVQCPQSFSLSGPGGSEDCLFVNVWTPRGKSGLPVMVWLHGGAFIFGSGGDVYYNGAYLATTGDPAAVTLFGESAGGFSACAHYVSPRGAGLFRAAISESGLCASTVREPTLAQAEAAGTTVATTLGCDGPGAAACMRRKSVDELLDATAPLPADQLAGGPFYEGGFLLSTLPNVDGFVVPRALIDAFAAADFEARPLILGSNREEGTLFHSVFFAAEVEDEIAYRAALERRFGLANVDAIVARYPIASFSSANRALAEITGDAFFACPARRTARGASAAAGGAGRVYFYSFERALEQPFLADLGVFHSSEIPFLFQSDPRFPLGRVGSGQPVADTLQGYWTRFAQAADPNGDGAVAWPTFDATGDRHLAIDLTTVEGSGLRQAACDFWDALVIP